MVRGRETNRIAGKIALKSPEPDAVKAESYFNRALLVSFANNKPDLGNSAPP